MGHTWDLRWDLRVPTLYFYLGLTVMILSPTYLVDIILFLNQSLLHVTKRILCLIIIAEKPRTPSGYGLFKELILFRLY